MQASPVYVQSGAYVQENMGGSGPSMYGLNHLGPTPPLHQTMDYNGAGHHVGGACDPPTHPTYTELSAHHSSQGRIQEAPKLTHLLPRLLLSPSSHPPDPLTPSTGPLDAPRSVSALTLPVRSKSSARVVWALSSTASFGMPRKSRERETVEGRRWKSEQRERKLQQQSIVGECSFSQGSLFWVRVLCCCCCRCCQPVRGEGKIDHRAPSSLPPKISEKSREPCEASSFHISTFCSPKKRLFYFCRYDGVSWGSLEGERTHGEPGAICTYVVVRGV
ncbi:hypothetical protein WMY93_002240 [Mugilogobius chulae]|uniref:DUF4074 domain-containing protein n=1 Tax=Mugilogobius chulae TaxID=88201 RepID=A0AAW0PW83_9GOBI